MILTGSEIKKEIDRGQIEIDPFNPENLNPNSYDVTLNEQLMIYKNDCLDSKSENKTLSIFINKYAGYKLQPRILYLARTNERTFSNHYVPMLEGRSSIGRLGIAIHVTAGFGDLGFNGFWTLELFCIQPVVIYPNTRIGQVYFHMVQGDIDRLYKGKYQDNHGIQSSMSYKDFR